MGVWGMDICENDTFQEVREEFIRQYQAGRMPADILEALKADYREDPCYLQALYALADCMWQCNTACPQLLSEIHDRVALGEDHQFLLDSGADDQMCQERRDALDAFLRRFQHSPAKEELISRISEKGAVFQKGQIFWYTSCKKHYGGLVVDVIEDFCLMAVSESISAKDITASDVLNAPLYTAAWFDVNQIELRSKLHYCGSIQINDNFNGRAGLQIAQNGSLTLCNWGNANIWKHTDRNLVLKGRNLCDILTARSLPKMLSYRY